MPGSHSLDSWGAMLGLFHSVVSRATRVHVGTAVVCALVLAALAACRERAAPARVETGRAGPGTVPRVGHVVVVVEENADYRTVIGGSAMPYLAGLARRYGLATQYYANTHPSIGNYFMMTVGKIITNDDGFSGTVSDDNVVRRLVAAGKTWKSYAEDLPAVGYTGASTGRYARKHNPLSFFSDVLSDTSRQRGLVPFSHFACDLAHDALPDYAFVVPNLCHDGHDCPLSTADNWLETNIDPLVRSARFQRDGLLIIVFDESGDDDTHGGGRIVWLVVSGRAKGGYQSNALYQHQSTLRLTLEALGVRTVPNAGASAPPMGEFFKP